jgi:GT2 family glycosyltransferase
MSLPQVDVIILSWNRVEDTLAAIASAAAQEDVDLKILIVDQGSEPQNLARVEAAVGQLPCARLLRLSRNVGVPGGRNLAAAMGNAPTIVALDSDAEFADPRVLSRAAQLLEARTDLCAIGFAVINYFSGETDWSSWDYPNHCSPDREFMATRFVGAGHAIRRHTFEAVGAYDERLMFCGEELDVCYRMLNLGQRIAYVPSLAVLHKVTQEQRVFWEGGRYFQTVRNALYTLYKFRTGWLRLVVAASAFLLRGMRNGIGMHAVRGMFAAIPMCLAFMREPRGKALYQLSPETWRYIRDCEPSRRDPWPSKLRRQLTPLPQQSSLDARRASSTHEVGVG